MKAGRRLVLDADPGLAEHLHRLAAHRMVFFAGLPGTGKSLLVHQLTHLAAGGGRRVHLLQWDVARPVFEATSAGRRYPPADGVTHAVVRKAAGLWVRDAVVAWSERYPESEDILVGETPLIGNRFVELAQRRDDRAEALLAAASCRFVVAVPSVEVKRFLEAERERRSATPLHAREREDAPPRVLRDLWAEVADVARGLGVAATATSYDPAAYRRVYERILRYRHVDVVTLDVRLPTETLSVYDFAVVPADVVPSPDAAAQLIGEIERHYPDPTTVERACARWWEV